MFLKIKTKGVENGRFVLLAWPFQQSTVIIQIFASVFLNARCLTILKPILKYSVFWCHLQAKEFDNRASIYHLKSRLVWLVFRYLLYTIWISELLSLQLAEKTKYGGCEVQWASEYQTISVFKWSKRGQMPNGLVYKCHLKTGQPNHLNIIQMDVILFCYVLVRSLNGWSST